MFHWLFLNKPANFQSYSHTCDNKIQNKHFRRFCWKLAKLTELYRWYFVPRIQYTCSNRLYRRLSCGRGLDRCLLIPKAWRNSVSSNQSRGSGRGSNRTNRAIRNRTRERALHWFLECDWWIGRSLSGSVLTETWRKRVIPLLAVAVGDVWAE